MSKQLLGVNSLEATLWTYENWIESWNSSYGRLLKEVLPFPLEMIYVSYSARLTAICVFGSVRFGLQI